MKKIIFTLVATAAIPLLLHAAKTKEKPTHAQATTQYAELSTALKTNKVLQATLVRDVEREIQNQDTAAIQKLQRQLKSLRNNEKLLNKEVRGLLKTYPTIKKKGG